MRLGLVLLQLLFTLGATAMDEMAVYELLAPDTHQFAIRYDVSATEPGSTVFFNIIRPGSETSEEKVLDRASGKELPFAMTTAVEARKYKQDDPEAKDDTKYIKVTLPHAVPENGEYRLRILKTYRDPKSYYSEKANIVFHRNLSVKRNALILPKGYRLSASSVPVIVTTILDGRIQVSMVNDRDDELYVHIVGKKLDAAADVTEASAQTASQVEIPDQVEFFHRAEDDREITYWMLSPEDHLFRFSHDFNIVRAGQKFAHSFVRKGSKVSEEITFIDLDTGKRLKTTKVTGKDVNALGYYPEKFADDDVVIQGELLSSVPEGGSVRIRVMETYTDEKRYFLDKNGELVWDRTFGRPRNVLTLPQGWMLSSCSVPAIIDEDEQGRLRLTLNNIRNDELHVVVRARKL